MSVWRQGARTPAWWIVAALGPALLAADLGGQIHHGLVDGKAVLFFAAMSVGIAAGLWVWAWRPRTRMGPLMFWWPALWVAGDLEVPYPTSRVAATVGLALYTIGPIVFAQMTLSYPTGKLQGRLAWIYIFVLGYSAQVIQNIGNLLFYDGRGCPFCTPQERSYLYAGHAPFSLDWWNRGWAIEIIAVLPIGLALVYRKLLRAGPGARRTFGPLALALTAGTIASWIVLFLIVIGDQEALASVSSLDWVLTSSALTGALFSFLGLAITRRDRGVVGDLVVELGRGRAGGVRAALARAIGDPSLELALWLPDRRVWVDEEGREVALPDGRERAVTLIGDVAAIVHDPVFLDQPAMLEAAGSAARFALENERLQAELRAQLAELRESRARIVRAGDEERRRLERDLHDGAQQRLLGIGMALQLLHSQNRALGDERLLDEIEAEVQAALHELRELARGIHPAVLTDQGLDAAMRTLAERAPIPVEVRVEGGAFPGEVETAVYFIVAEALANVTKHARASKASVDVEQRNGLVRVQVTDDGIGGAELDGGGTGLRGLVDRAGALDGRVRLDSPAGAGTRLSVELPCGS